MKRATKAKTSATAPTNEATIETLADLAAVARAEATNTAHAKEKPTETTNATSAAPTKAARTPLPRRKFFDDMPDKGLFGFVAVFGFGIITALKIFDYNADAVAAIAVALMLAYGVIAYRIPAVALRLDRLGDNFYYLGFIFTLASLSAALIQLRSSQQIEPILGSFGIALVTTIVGVAGRVLFTQMRTEIEEIEDAIRRDLAEASNELKSQLSISLREFETFHVSVQQVSKEALDRINSVSTIQEDRVGNAADLVAGRITSAFEANQKHAEALIGSIANITRSVEDLQVRLSSVGIPTEAIEKQLNSIGVALEHLIGRVSTSLDGMTERLSAMKLPTKRIEEQIDSFGHELEQRLLQRLLTVAEDVQQIQKKRTTTKKRRWYWPFR